MNLGNIFEVIKNWILGDGSQIVILLVVGFIIYKFIRPVITKIIRKAVTEDPHLTKEEEVRREDTLIKIVTGTVKIATIIFVALMILSEFGIDIGPLIAGAGVVGLALGFGGQYLVKDIITGLFIILENQYRVGDVVKIAGIAGLVEDVSLRVTILRDLDGTVHHIPHGDITTVSNMAKGFSRVNLNIGVSYNTDIEKVKEVINRVGNELAEDPDFKENIIDAPKYVRIDSFDDSSISIKILGETKPLAQWEIAGEMRARLKKAFDEEGVEIPFPQMVIHQDKK
ncbi:mechanosensitive ion channel family protein [Candidatus Parcubacteria bacterium]|nr:mechanosensitive ion channel family protein [Candidatus Parcubacteria bacterium]